MAHVKRSDTGGRSDPVPQHADADYRYDAGGHIAQLQADLAQRLMDQGAGRESSPADQPAERIIRYISVGGGYFALFAGYAAAALVIAYWI